MRKNFDDVDIGDVIEKEIGNGEIVHCQVRAKGTLQPHPLAKLSRSSSVPEPVLYVTVLEYPNWQDGVVTIHDKIIKITRTKEVVRFS
jgi:hypothetical protein